MEDDYYISDSSNYDSGGVNYGDDYLGSGGSVTSTYNISDGGVLNGTESPPMLSNVEGYCGPTLAAIGVAYARAHGFTSLIVCFFGCLANLLNLIVLTRKEMINPTNIVLTGLAMADLLNEVEYMPFALFMRALKSPPKTYGWAVFVLSHSNFSQVCHTISIWLTVTLAVWRYIMVAMPMKNKTLCTMERAKLAVGIAYVSSLIVCVPVYLSFSIRSSIPLQSKTTTTPPLLSSDPTDFGSMNNVSNGTPPVGNPLYYVYYSELAMEHDKLLINANFWIYSVVIKIIPCIVLTVVSLRLVNSLMEAKRRKEMLMSKRPSAAGSHHGEESGSDRTTRMLLAVLLLFLITEFPQGILGLLSGLLGDSFFRSCYMPLGDLMDIVALLNSAINFILYCSMSKKFRETFVQVFHLKGILSRAAGNRSGGGGVISDGTVVANGNGNSQYTSV